MFSYEYQALTTIANEPSTTGKIELLKRSAATHGSHLKTILYLALSEHTTFHIEQFPNYSDTPKNGARLNLVQLLTEMSTARSANTEDKCRLFMASAAWGEETYEVVRRICNKDLRCGISAKNANKAIPGVVLITPYMRCSGREKLTNIKYPAIAQVKCDGAFCYAIVYEGSVRFLTRKGRLIHGLDHIANAMRKDSDYALSGELCVYTDKTYTSIMPRAEGNGLVNKAIKNTATPEELSLFYYTAWDMLTYKEFMLGYSNVWYSERLSDLTSIPENHFVRKILSNTVSSPEEAQEYYLRLRQFHFEGAVIKSSTGIWKSYTSPEQVKLKAANECELIVTGWNYGKPHTKYSDCMGSVNAESKCGELKVSLSGFTDEDRLINWDDLIGSIIEVEFETVSKGKNNDFYSLSHPRFSKLRPDRNEADSLKQILGRQQ